MIEDDEESVENLGEGAEEINSTFTEPHLGHATSKENDFDRRKIFI